MKSPFEDIYEFNEKAGYLEKGYSAWAEAAYQLEEAMEGFHLQYIASRIRYPDIQEKNAKNLARYILSGLPENVKIDKVDAVDKACDTIVFAFGALYKLGFDADTALDVLKIVTTANKQKLDDITFDDKGKVIKSEAFIGPEKAIEDYMKDHKLI